MFQRWNNGVTINHSGRSVSQTYNTVYIIASQTEPPLSPSTPILASQHNVVSSSIITLDWDSPSSTGGVSVTQLCPHYLPKPFSGSPVTVETTSAQITVSYNTLYNVTIRAVNCVGMSDASMLVTIPSIG